MADVDDGFAAYYAERLWQLMPAVYRQQDSDSLTEAGPLRELLDRIGAQVAVVRRSIDRLWEDQSIETCDDWVIPYIGDLLDTNLVNRLDAAGQRLDVAKTIHYRRRKGTLEVLEELARDVTGWPAHVVEGFSRLARSRHGLDPAVGPLGYAQAVPGEVNQLLALEGLTGRLTGGPAGGLADLRSHHGAALADGPFDEDFHMADVRVGQGALGHFGIPKLLVFLWRLISFPVVAGTPVPVAGCTDQWVFDPTGREVPLFLPPARVPDDFAEDWTPAREWQVPGPLTDSLEWALSDTGGTPPPPLRAPYPDNDLPTRYALGGGAALEIIWPELGRFETTGAPPDTLTVDYQYGFSSHVGAGPYDRDLLGDPPTVTGTETLVSGGTGLDAALGALSGTGTVTVADSRTYGTLAAVGSTADPIVSVLVRAGASQRPVLRAPGSGPWVLTGGGEAELVLDGLTVSGCDVVLRGAFDTVRITGCTLDPGTAATGSPPLASAVDGVVLAPCRLFIEADPAAAAGEGGAIRQLLVDHSILGPVRSRFGGSVETLAITDSIVQGLPASVGPTYAAADVFDPVLLTKGLLADDPVSAGFVAAMGPGAASALAAFAAEPAASQEAGPSAALVTALDTAVNGPSLYDATTFRDIDLSPDVLALAAQAATLDAAHLELLNRGLLDDSYPVALAVAALAVADATVELTRVSVLGRTFAHRLYASDSILADFTAVDDTQDGCVRFSAYARGSVLPRQYESAAVRARAPLFTSDAFGQPGYAQLLETADLAVVGGTAGVAILTGAETASEMGAFSADLNPIKEQGLLIKYAEYMPLGLTPVVIHVT